MIPADTAAGPRRAAQFPAAAGATSQTVGHGWLQALTGAATAGALGVAVVAFIGSFHALAGFAVEVGVATSGNAWTWPVVIDVTILVATAGLVARSLRARPTGYPSAVTFTFVALSVAVNAAHALDPLTGLPRSAAAMSLAALLPIALAVCVHLVVLELHDLLTPAPDSAPASGWTAGQQEAAPPHRPDQSSPGGAAHAVTAAPPADTQPDSAADPDSPPAPDVRSGGHPDTVDALVAGHLSGGGQLADGLLTAAVAAALGVTDRTARRRLQPYRDGHIRPLTHPASARSDVA